MCVLHDPVSIPGEDNVQVDENTSSTPVAKADMQNTAVLMTQAAGMSSIANNARKGDQDNGEGFRLDNTYN